MCCDLLDFLKLFSILILRFFLKKLDLNLGFMACLGLTNDVQIYQYMYVLK